MLVYKIRHIPSELFFTVGTTNGLQRLGTIYVNPNYVDMKIANIKQYWDKGNLYDTNKTEWRKVQYALVER